MLTLTSETHLFYLSFYPIIHLLERYYLSIHEVTDPSSNAIALPSHLSIMYIYLSVDIFILISIYPYKSYGIYPTSETHLLYLSIYLLVYVFISLHLSIFILHLLSFNLAINLYDFISIHLSIIYMSLIFISTHLSIYMSFSIHLSTYDLYDFNLYFYSSVYLYVFFYPSIYNLYVFFYSSIYNL